PHLRHVSDSDKEQRIVDAELGALLQAAGGTFPVNKKNEKGVDVIVESGEHAHPPAATPAKPAVAPAPKAAATPSKPPVAPAPPTPTQAQASSAAEKSMMPPAPKAEAEPNRSLNRRSTYSGVVDTGP